MRKNKLFIAGLVTVFVALVSLTLVSSTWAKYTSTSTGSDTARVAYWGFNTESKVVIDDLFKNVYDNVSASADVVAPGTNNTVTVKYQPNGGAPEVAYEIKYELTFSGSLVDELDANKNFMWTYNGTEYETSAKLAEAVSKTVQYQAGQYNETFTIGWTWAFTSGDADDVEDTKLGNAALTNGSVVLTLKATATQLD